MSQPTPPAGPPPGTVILNVCVLPDERVGEHCVRLSSSLADGSTLFSLGGGRFPHMTMFMARFPESAVGDVRDAVATLLEGAAAVHCEATGYFLTAGRYVEVSYARTAGMDQLHTQLIDLLAPLRANPGNPYVEGYFAPYTDEQRHNAETTGYDLAYELFRPHITLTRYVEGAAPNQLPDLPDVATLGLSFPLSTVGLYLADDNGAVHTQVDRWTVRSS